jgi:hypothetical protein
MSRHDDPIDYESQRPETVSSRRRPQFNQSNCGYRCGLGCCEPREGDDDDGGSGGDSTPTLVGSEDEDEADLEISHQEVDEAYQDRVAEEGEVGPNPITMNAIEENLYLSRTVVDQENPFIQSQSSRSNLESPSSLENQANSELPSSAVSEVGQIGNVLLLGWDAGMGGAFEGSEPDRCPLTHHFLVRPLRLSPQYEHCRGPAASHLVIQDYSNLLDVVEVDWRAWMPGNSNALYHDVE